MKAEFINQTNKLMILDGGEAFYANVHSGETFAVELDGTEFFVKVKSEDASHYVHSFSQFGVAHLALEGEYRISCPEEPCYVLISQKELHPEAGLYYHQPILTAAAGSCVCTKCSVADLPEAKSAFRKHRIRDTLLDEPVLDLLSGGFSVGFAILIILAVCCFFSWKWLLPCIGIWYLMGVICNIVSDMGVNLLFKKAFHGETPKKEFARWCDPGFIQNCIKK